MNEMKLMDLGRIDYKIAWDKQTVIHKALIAQKRGEEPDDDRQWQDTLMLCEHNPVFTLGRSGDQAHLLRDPDSLKQMGIEYYRINRGGDITYHGPGQLVAYPIIDLENWKRDVHWYVRSLEEVVIQVLAEYGLQGLRNKGYTGVWLNDGKQWRKICAIGVHLSRWVSLHGLAFNIQADLNHFNYIVPCGIQDPDKTVTNLCDETEGTVDFSEVKKVFIQKFQETFECQLKDQEEIN